MDREFTANSQFPMPDSELSHADRTLRGLRHIGSARLVTQLITWGFTAVTIHLLQPRDYGLIAMAGIVTTLAQLLMDGGLSEVLIGQRELPAVMEGAATSAVLLVSAALAAIVIAIAPFVTEFFRSPPLKAILDVSAFYLPLAALAVVPMASLSKHMRFDRIALAQTIGSVVQGASTLGLAYSGEGYWALIIGNFIGTALRIGLLWASLEHKPVPNLRLSILRPLLRNSAHMVGQRLTYFSIDNFDIFLLSRFGGPIVLGPYSVARTLSYSALNQISGIVNQVAVPAFAAKTDTEAQLRGMLFVISLAAATLFPLFWIMSVASPVGLPLVFGARWSNLVVPFLAFTAILPLRGIYALVNASLIGTGRTGTTFWNTLIWAAVMIPLMLLGLAKGADGVALSWTVGFPLVFCVTARRISRDLSARVATLLKPMLIPAACAGASAAISEAALLCVASHVGPSHAAQSALVAWQCSIAAVCYWLFLRTFGRAQHMHTLTIIRRLVRV